MKTFALLLLCLFCTTAMPSAPRPKPASELMEKKTRIAQDMLRRLALGDVAAVKSDAEEMQRITEEAGFSDKNEDYAAYGREFIRTVVDLKTAAAEGDLEKSCREFTRMTTGCFSCHEHLRGR